MNKKLFFVAVALSVLTMVGCSDNQDPYHDTTKLWPAYSSSNKSWGYIDKSGQFAIQPMYDWVSGFSCGYALVRMGSQYTFIDTKGHTQSSPTIDDGTEFYYNYAVVESDGGYGLLNTKFTFTIQPYLYEASENIGDNGLLAAKMSSGDKWGYMNTSGEQIIQPMYDWADPFKDGGAVVYLNNKCAVIDKKNQYLIPFSDDELYNVGDGIILCWSQDGEKCSIKDLKGNVVVQPIYAEFGEPVDNKLIPAYDKNEKCGYIDYQGNVKIPFNYDAVDPFFEGYAFVKQSDALLCIDTKGQVVFRVNAPKDGSVWAETGFHNGLARIAMRENGKWWATYQYVNTQGRVVYQYDDPYASYYSSEPAHSTNATLSLRDKCHIVIENTLHFRSDRISTPLKSIAK